ncbi:MAG: hypothetical protein ABFD82_06890 [Syntrophaceae bacterium]
MPPRFDTTGEAYQPVCPGMFRTNTGRCTAPLLLAVVQTGFVSPPVLLPPAVPPELPPVEPELPPPPPPPPHAVKKQNRTIIKKRTNRMTMLSAGAFT